MSSKQYQCDECSKTTDKRPVTPDLVSYNFVQLRWHTIRMNDGVYYDFCSWECEDIMRARFKLSGKEKTKKS